jgi:hypothetical protein
MNKKDFEYKDGMYFVDKEFIGESKWMSLEEFSEFYVTVALELFKETMPLKGMNPRDPQFKDLFSKECVMFDMIRQMSSEELEMYRVNARRIHTTGDSKKEISYT